MLQQYDRVMRDHVAKHRNLQRRYEKIFKADAEPDDDRVDDDIDEERLDGDNGSDSENGNGNDEPRHLVDQLADLMVEAGSSDGEVSREDALRYLLHSERGQALVARMSQHRKQIDAVCRKFATGKGKDTMNRSEQLRAVVKRAGGIMPLCKSIATSGRSSVTEHELTQLVVDAAKREHPDMSDAAAFSKAFCDAGPTGMMLRQAIAVAKAAQVDGDDGDADDPAAALEELHRLAEQHHRDSPELTPDQSFARVFADPRNAALAARAHRRPVANEKNAFPFPR
jgi:hypothetical protein